MFGRRSKNCLNWKCLDNYVNTIDWTSLDGGLHISSYYITWIVETSLCKINGITKSKSNFEAVLVEKEQNCRFKGISMQVAKFKSIVIGRAQGKVWDPVSSGQTNR